MKRFCFILRAHERTVRDCRARCRCPLKKIGALLFGIIHVDSNLLQTETLESGPTSTNFDM